jgi:hypothetical protein
MNIKIKIKREDKEVMYQLLERLIRPIKPKDMQEINLKETAKQVSTKLYRTMDSDGSVSLAVDELMLFMAMMKGYAAIGDYEMANAMGIVSEINKKLKKKYPHYNG